MSSINTNLSAMTALQALKSTQTAMNKTQNQISTGLRVGEAADNASYWSIATQMKSDNGALSSVKDAIGQSTAMINTYTSAMDKTLTYLNKMKQGLVSASQPGADVAKIQTEFQANIEGMKSAAESASFNGQNWLEGNGGVVNLVTSYDGVNNKVNTLAIDTSKTTLFTDASTLKGGLLERAAAVDISALVPQSGTEAKHVASDGAGGKAEIDLASTDVKAGAKVEWTKADGTTASLVLDGTATTGNLASKLQALDSGVKVTYDSTAGKLTIQSNDETKDVAGAKVTKSDGSPGPAPSTNVADEDAGTNVPMVSGTSAGSNSWTIAAADWKAGAKIEWTGTNGAKSFTLGASDDATNIQATLQAMDSSVVVAYDSTTGAMSITGATNTDDVTAAKFTKSDGAGPAAPSTNPTDASTGTVTAHTGTKASVAGSVSFAADNVEFKAGNKVSFTIGTTTTSYTMVDGDDGAKLAAAINKASQTDATDASTATVKATWDATAGLKIESVDASKDVSGTFTFGAQSDQIAGALKDIDTAIAKVTEGSSILGANKALLETQAEFISSLSDSLTAGVSTFVDADMNEASTRYQALQTQQQLGVQALSMANQNSQMILRLFQ